MMATTPWRTSVWRFLGLLHGKSVVPRASTSAGGETRPIELRDVVRHGGDPLRQLHPPDDEGASPAAFDTLFMKAIDAAGPLTPFQSLDGRALIALDGTEHFCSRKIKCQQ
jgi:hypothetical protein